MAVHEWMSAELCGAAPLFAWVLIVLLSGVLLYAGFEFAAWSIKTLKSWNEARQAEKGASE